MISGSSACKIRLKCISLSLSRIPSFQVLYDTNLISSSFDLSRVIACGKGTGSSPIEKEIPPGSSGTISPSSSISEKTSFP